MLLQGVMKAVKRLPAPGPVGEPGRGPNPWKEESSGFSTRALSKEKTRPDYPAST